MLRRFRCVQIFLKPAIRLMLYHKKKGMMEPNSFPVQYNIRVTPYPHGNKYPSERDGSRSCNDCNVNSYKPKVPCSICPTCPTLEKYPLSANVFHASMNIHPTDLRYCSMNSLSAPLLSSSTKFWKLSPPLPHDRPCPCGFCRVPLSAR